MVSGMIVIVNQRAQRDFLNFSGMIRQIAETLCGVILTGILTCKSPNGVKKQHVNPVFLTFGSLPK
jgi:hypothetical protein